MRVTIYGTFDFICTSRFNANIFICCPSIFHKCGVSMYVFRLTLAFPVLQLNPGFLKHRLESHRQLFILAESLLDDWSKNTWV